MARVIGDYWGFWSSVNLTGNQTRGASGYLDE